MKKRLVNFLRLVSVSPDTMKITLDSRTSTLDTSRVRVRLVKSVSVSTAFIVQTSHSVALGKESTFYLITVLLLTLIYMSWFNVYRAGVSPCGEFWRPTVQAK